MDIRQKTSVIEQQNPASFAGIDSDTERLNAILAANAKIACEQKTFRNDQERLEASLMKNPVSTERAFAYFGLLLGLFPPAAIFIQFLKDNLNPGMIIFLTFVNLACALGGYFSGKLIGQMIASAERLSWHKMLLATPLLGILWGIIAGATGGFFIFGIGALFGAFIAAIIGSFAFPFFTIFHRILKRGEVIERKHFLPLAFGVSFIVSAFILGL